MWINTRPKRQYKTSKRRPELTAGSVGSCFKLEKISCSNLRPAKLGETLNEEKEMKNKIKKCRVILVYGRQSSEDAHGGRDLLFCVHPASSAVKKEKFEYFCLYVKIQMLPRCIYRWLLLKQGCHSEISKTFDLKIKEVTRSPNAKIFPRGTSLKDILCVWLGFRHKIGSCPTFKRLKV